jgi:hypothetical protein
VDDRYGVAHFLGQVVRVSKDSRPIRAVGALAIQKHLAATERFALDASSSILVRHGFRASESEFLSIRAARLRMAGGPQVHQERANLGHQTFSECERD